MPDVRKLKTFLKKDDLRKNDVVEFKNAGTIEEKDFSKEQDGSRLKTVLTMKVSLNGTEPKDLNINQTSVDSLSKSWGPSTEDWVGKRAIVNFVKMMSFGKVQDVLLLEADTGRTQEATQNLAQQKTQWEQEDIVTGTYTKELKPVDGIIPVSPQKQDAWDGE